MSVAEKKTSAVSPESPWLGLDPFTEGVREYFFGRDLEVRELFQRVVHKPLTVLFGQSGLGKTSLLQAALVPRLRDAGFLPIVLRLDYTEDSAALVRQFVETLTAGLAPAIPGLETSLSRLPTDMSLPWLLFHDPVFGLTSLEAPRPVVLLDQFEEIFTRGQATPDRKAAAEEFLEMLADLVENRVPESLRALLETDDALANRLDYAARPAMILLSLREDFLHLLERHRGRMPSLMDNRYELRLLSGPQALEAVIEPGRKRWRHNKELEPLVSEATGGAIVRFVAGVAPDIPLAEIDTVPPLLSLLCAELNEQRRRAGETVIRPEQLKGRAEDILEHFYERCFSSQPAAVRKFVEDRLLSADGFRESATVDTATHELVRAGLTRVAAVEAIAGLVDSRLLTSEERAGVLRIELTHDILTGVARRSRDLRQKAEAAAQRRRRRNRLIGVIFCLALFIAGTSIPLAVWALRERKGAIRQKKIAVAAENDAVQRSKDAEIANRNLQAKNRELRSFLEEAARSDRLVAQGNLQAGRDAEALAYLARASRYTPEASFPAEAAISAILSPPIAPSRATLQGYSAVFSPDGRRVLSISRDNTAQLWEADTGKLLATFQGHTDAVRRAMFSPDGRRVLTASDDKTARLWEADTGKLLVTFQGHTEPVKIAVFSPDGQRVLTASDDKTARLWEADTGKLLVTFRGHTDAVRMAVFSPVGPRVLTVSEDNMVRLWEADTGKLLARFQGHTDKVYHAVLSPNGQRVLTASGDGTARLWEANTGKPLGTFQDAAAAMFSPDGRRVLIFSNVSLTPTRLRDADTGKPLTTFRGPDDDVARFGTFSPDGRRVLTASYDKTARLWEADTGKLLATFQGHTDRVNDAEFSPDGLWVLTASDDSTARLWEADTGKLLVTFQGHTDKVYYAVFSPDGQRVLTASADGTARLWEADTGKLFARFEGHTDRVCDAVFSPNGQRVLTASLDHTVRLWEADTSKLVVTFRGHTDSVESAMFSRDGRRVLTASDDKTARLWEADTGKLLATFQGHTDKVYYAVFSPDGQRVLTASEDSTARLWEADTGKLLVTFQGHTEPLRSAVFSPDGQRVLTASADGTARLWEADTGKLLATFQGHGSWVNRAVFSPNGRRVLTASLDHTVRLWEADTSKLVVTFRGHTDSVESAMFSRDGRRVLTASDDKTARLWEADTGKLLATFQGHTDAVKMAVFSPDGQRVLTASEDSTARLWEADTGKLLATFQGHTEPLRSAVFSPDGQRVLTSSEDGTARLWMLLPANVPPPDWFAGFLVWLGGKRIAADGEIETLSGDELGRLEDQLRPHLKEASDYARLLRWRLLPPHERPVDPYGTITQEQAADLIIRTEMNQYEAEHAYNLDPWHPLIHLALAGFKRDTICADFLRRYSLDRLPNDPKLHQRAAEFLRKQGKENLAREVEVLGNK